MFFIGMNVDVSYIDLNIHVPVVCRDTHADV